VRRYYRQDFSGRLRQLFAPINVSPRQSGFGQKQGGYGQKSAFNQNAFGQKKGFGQYGEGGWRGAGSSRDGRGQLMSRDDTYIAASPHLAAGPLHRGHRAAVPRREALILLTAINYPWLLHDHLEELAAAEFRHADTQKLKGALIDVFVHHFADDFAHDSGQDPEHFGAAERAALAAELGKRGFTELLDRIGRSITTQSVWGAGPNAAESDVLQTWKQLVALHTQWHSLTRELRDAEAALGQDNTEANYARLRDVKSRLSTLDGTEALIEGFGASSGRAAKSM
jgi:DNA primase